MKRIFLTLALMFPLVAFAVPATIEVTVTELSDDGTGGVPDNYRLYSGCDLTTQSVGAVLADPITVGSTYTFSGDTDFTYALCTIPYNVAGDGSGFDNIVEINFTNVRVPPGRGRIMVSCYISPSSGVHATCNARRVP